MLFTGEKEPHLLRLAVACAGCIILGMSRIFWSQALVSNVYSLHAFLLVLLIYLGVLVPKRLMASNLAIPLIAFVFGLGMSNHHTIALALPGIAVLLWQDFKTMQRKNWMITGMALIAGFLPYLYLPLRAAHGPSLNWGDPSNWERFWKVVLRQRYGTFLPKNLLQESFGALSFFRNILVYCKRIAEQFSIIGLAAGAIGAYRMFLNREYKMLLALGIIFILIGPGFFVFGNAPMIPMYQDMVMKFYVSSAVIFTIWIAVCLRWLVERLAGKDRLVRTAGLIAVVVAVPALCWFNLSHSNRCGRDIAGRFNALLLKMLPQDSILFVAGDATAFPLSYLKMVEKRAKDVTVYDDTADVFENIYGKDFDDLAGYAQDERRTAVQRRILDGGKPVCFCIGTNLSNIGGFTFFPWGMGFRAGKVTPVDIARDWQEFQGDVNLLLNFCDRTKKEKWTWMERELVSYFYYYVGEFFFVMNRTKEGLVFFNNASNAGTDNHIIQLDLGVSLQNKGHFNEALEYFSKDLEINPRDFVAYKNLGIIFDTAGKYQNAINAYQKSLEITPWYIDAREGLAVVYGKTGLYDKAIAEFQENIRLNPLNSRSHFNIAIMYGQKGNFDLAEKELNETLRLDSGYEPARQALIKLQAMKAPH